MKNFTKRLIASAMTAAMALSMVGGLSASASESPVCNSSLNYTNAIMPLSINKKITYDIEPVEQDKTKWCWAACLQMVLTYNGISMTQTEIVEAVNGNDDNDYGGSVEMAEFLAEKTKKNFVNESGRFNTVTTKLTYNPVIIVGSMTSSDGTTTPHSVLCTGYSTDNRSHILYINDPYSGIAGTLTGKSDTATSFTMELSDGSTYDYTMSQLVCVNH